MKRKLAAAAAALILACTFAGCGGDSAPAQQTASAPAAQTEAVKGGKVLIAYFTWAENAPEADASKLDMDMPASASVILPGNMAKISGWIQEETGGDLFSIRTAEPYSNVHEEVLDRAAEEKADKARPALTGTVDNMADYDVIFLAYPNWWNDMPMAVYTFLDAYDLSGKTLIPVCTSGVNGLANTVEAIREAEPGARVLEGYHLKSTDIPSAEQVVKDWVHTVYEKA